PKEQCESLSFAEIKRRFHAWLFEFRLEYVDDWKVVTIDDEVCVDFVIRYERLHEGFEEVCRRLNVPFEPAKLPRIKGEYNPRRWHFSAYYDRDTMQYAADAFARARHRFGYPLPA